MICPHCQASLLRKERTGSVCSKCQRRFALDPKLHGRGMHDTRVRRIAGKATDSGRRKVTLTQLWYLARSSNPSWSASPASGRPRWAGRLVATVLVVGLVVFAFFARDIPGGALMWWISLGLAFVVYKIAKGDSRLPARRASAFVVPALRDFRSMMRGPWVSVYKGLPPGIVDDEHHRETDQGTITGRPPRSSGPKPPVALLCPDRAVRVFLSVNDIPRRLNLTLAARPAELPGTGPVVVLHDAGAEGCELVADVRASRPGEVVVDAGLPVRAARTNRRGVRLHETPPWRVAGDPSDWPDWLRQLADVAPEDAEWLAQGWVGPVAAVPPAVLESAVERAVTRARDALDPARRAAVAVGFMSWPEPTAEDGN
ncbi:hypothetical protein [Streptomyces sp. NPDC057877]|uniref:hypothetical protein n=1 Tax=Streptomyces sp. NPDC057877 TaxID=3346269 RepID=UPI0036B3179C